MNKVELQYNGDFNDIVSIKKLEKQVIINALSFTNTVEEASLEIGITKRTVYRYMDEWEIGREELNIMRTKFQISGKKIKRRFNLNN